jgi:hypothetical protein
MNTRRHHRTDYTSRVLESSFAGNEPDKKNAEQAILRTVLRRLGRRDVVILPGESPDFHISLDGVRIGVELTGYHFDSNKKGSRGHTLFQDWRRISNLIRQSFRRSERALHSWYGAIHFRPPFDRSLASLRAAEFVREITSLAQQRLLGVNAQGWIRLDEFKLHRYLQETVNFINCQTREPEILPLWWHAHLQSGLVPDPTPFIKAAILAKESKAKNYSTRNLKELWLLIHARASDLSESVGGVSEDNLAVLSTLKIRYFNKVLLWDRFLETVWEVWPKARIVTTVSF